jgi:hypothetical protein
LYESLNAQQLNITLIGMWWRFSAKGPQDTKSKKGASHFCSPPLKIGVRSQESGARRKEEEGRRKEPEEVFLQI